MDSSSDSSDDFICKCPVCGEELAELDEMWRQIHINGCLTRERPSMLQRCQTEECPVCKAKLGHLSAQLATRHINECLDRNARREASTRQTERCQFCGQCIKDMSERQRKLHDQTCRRVDHIHEAQVIHYPKVVESLETPEEWLLQPQQPELRVIPPKRSASERIQLFGKVFRVNELERVDGLLLRNEPFELVVPPDLAQKYKLDEEEDVQE